MRGRFRGPRGSRRELLDYDTPEIKTIDHVCVRGDEEAAWSADSEGNILCLHERVIGDTGH